MRIYTQILIGMAVGVVLGLTLGPKSSLLRADTYAVTDAATLHARLDRRDEGTEVALPPVALELRVLDLVRERVEDAAGEGRWVPTWARVRFPFRRALALRDPDGSLRDALGARRVGDAVELWIRIDRTALPGGGFVVRPERVSGLGLAVLSWVRPLGVLFMKLIKMVIVPLVFASLLVGVASLGDIRKLGRLGTKTLGAYLLTTAVAVTLGLLCAHVLRPGTFIGVADRTALQAQFAQDAGERSAQAAASPSAIDNLLNIVPENPIGSLAQGDMLQIIFFAVIFGIAITLLDRDHGSPVVAFFQRVQDAMVVVIHIVMATAPFGVAALVADVVGQSGISVLSALVVYGMTVLIGLALHAALVYGSMIVWLTPLPLLGFLRAIRPAQLIAFSTSSSSATLPVSMECAEESLGVSNSVSSFILPLGSTVNMDGTALYQGVAAVFIAQVFNLDLSLGTQLGIVATATMASIGAAGVPGAGMITLAMVLTTAGIPAVGIALILGMDRLLDMFRTAVNVTGDLAVTSAVAATEGERLVLLSPEDDARDPDRGFEGRLDRQPHPVGVDGEGPDDAG
ncbi:MAG: dicarboxylate/amino acid:cation symporter [Sandaracinaceae bacterium]